MKFSKWFFEFLGFTPPPLSHFSTPAENENGDSEKFSNSSKFYDATCCSNQKVTSPVLAINFASLSCVTLFNTKERCGRFKCFHLTSHVLHIVHWSFSSRRKVFRGGRAREEKRKLINFPPALFGFQGV